VGKLALGVLAILFALSVVTMQPLGLLGVLVLFILLMYFSTSK